MIFNIHAGHNPSGKIACGAVGYLNESDEARKVKDKVVKLLKDAGHTVYDCTCNDGENSLDVLNKIVKKCNAHVVDLDVSIHFNAGVDEKESNGSSAGTEVFVYSKNSKSCAYADNIVKNISELGFKNRGVKVNPGLYVLKKTKSPALLIECCFVDDPDDTNLYNADKMAIAIAEGLGIDKHIDINVRLLKKGLSGRDVEILQTLLNRFINAGLDIDGEFGLKTDVAVRNYQRKQNLDIDGCVGKQTWSNLIQ